MSALTYTELRSLCRELLHELEISPPVDPIVLCRRLGKARGRAIQLHLKPIPTSAAAASLMVGPKKYIITYQKSTTVQLQAHIIYHEVLHIVRDHTAGDGTLMCGALMSTDQGGGTQKNLYEDWAEWEAETGATILSEWSTPYPAQLQSATDRRLGAAFDAWNLR